MLTKLDYSSALPLTLNAVIKLGDFVIVRGFRLTIVMIVITGLDIGARPVGQGK